MDRIIYLLNDQSDYTGISTVAKNIHSAVPNSRILSLVMNTKNNGNKFLGNVYYGLKLNHLQLWPLNAYLQKFVFRNVYNKILNDKNYIIHYMNISIYPVIIDNSIITIHDLFGIAKEYKGHLIYSKLLKKNLRTYKKFKNVVTVSNFVKQDCEDYGFNGNITTIYPPITEGIYKIDNKNKLELRKKYNIPDEKKVIINVSNNFGYKNVKLLKPIMEKLGTDYYLIHVGSELSNFRSFTKINVNTLNELYNLSDISLLPSSREGFGSPYVESMATGLPVVASDIPIAREVCDYALVPSELSINSFVKSIKYLDIKDSSEKSLKRSLNFSFSVFKENINQYYNGLYY